MINNKPKTSSKMKQRILVMAFLVINLSIISSPSFAQKGNKALQITGEAIIPSAQKSVGFGLLLKGLYSIGEHVSITISAGVAKYKVENIDDAQDAIVRFLPFFIGYKQNINKFYLEPKVGIGELGGRILMTGGDLARPSVMAAFGGLEAGYTFKQFSLGFDFLATRGISNSSAGIWHNKRFNYASIFISYTLFKKSK